MAGGNRLNDILFLYAAQLSAVSSVLVLEFDAELRLALSVMCIFFMKKGAGSKAFAQVTHN